MCDLGAVRDHTATTTGLKWCFKMLEAPREDFCMFLKQMGKLEGQGLKTPPFDHILQTHSTVSRVKEQGSLDNVRHCCNGIFQIILSLSLHRIHLHF